MLMKLNNTVFECKYIKYKMWQNQVCVFWKKSYIFLRGRLKNEIFIFAGNLIKRELSENAQTTLPTSKSGPDPDPRSSLLRVCLIVQRRFSSIPAVCAQERAPWWHCSCAPWFTGPLGIKCCFEGLSGDSNMCPRKRHHITFIFIP